MEEGPLSAGVGRGAQRLGERLPEMQRKRSRTDALLHAYTVEHLRRDRMSCMRLQPRVSQVVAACMRSTFRTTQLSTILSRARHAGMASTVQSGPLHPYSQRLQPLPSLELSQAHAGPFALPGFASAMLQGRGLAIVQKPRMHEVLGTQHKERDNAPCGRGPTSRRRASRPRGAADPAS